MIVACGFVSSGTRLLWHIIKDDMGQKAIHRSYPHWEKLWDWKDYPDTVQWVAISRRKDIAIRSAHEAQHPGVRKNILRDPPATIKEIQWWHERWTRMSADMPAYWVSYEELVADPPKVIGQLAAHLAYTGPIKYRQIRDENAKYV